MADAADCAQQPDPAEQRIGTLEAELELARSAAPEEVPEDPSLAPPPTLVADAEAVGEAEPEGQAAPQAEHLYGPLHERATTRLAAAARGRSARAALAAERDSATLARGRAPAVVGDHAAATRVQAMVRGNAERGRIAAAHPAGGVQEEEGAGEAEADESGGLPDARHDAATALAAVQRGRAARATLASERQAATALAAAERGRAVRTAVALKAVEAKGGTASEVASEEAEVAAEAPIAAQATEPDTGLENPAWDGEPVFEHRVPFVQACWIHGLDCALAEATRKTGPLYFRRLSGAGRRERT